MRFSTKLLSKLVRLQSFHKTANTSRQFNFRPLSVVRCYIQWHYRFIMSAFQLKIDGRIFWLKHYALACQRSPIFSSVLEESSMKISDAANFCFLVHLTFLSGFFSNVDHFSIERKLLKLAREEEKTFFDFWNCTKETCWASSSWSSSEVSKMEKFFSLSLSNWSTAVFLCSWIKIWKLQSRSLFLLSTKENWPISKGRKATCKVFFIAKNCKWLTFNKLQHFAKKS